MKFYVSALVGMIIKLYLDIYKQHDFAFRKKFVQVLEQVLLRLKVCEISVGVYCA